MHDLKTYYIWALNLNSIPITNVSTGTHNFNAQTYICMRMCKTYVDNMWHSLKALKSCRYVYMSWRSVVIKQWFVHELCGGEQIYIQCVYISLI